MSKLRIDESKNILIKDNKPFFYLADTIWSAFTNVTLEEWDYYLKKRKMQGFNVLQINTLPQWDRCMSDVGVYPFPTTDGQQFSFSAFHEEYYERARKMCEMAVEQGFLLALIVLWLNYVPGTWGSRMFDKNIMPKDFVAEYAKKIVQEFDEYNPIYVISGDTDFDTPETISYYKTALDVICEKSPDSLKTLHIKRGYDVLPAELLDKIDFYMFQSGHNKKEQDMAFLLPERIAKQYPKKPMINAEPCYEQMGYSREEYGRFQADDIRRAAWLSLLSGACAGVTYGAHGIWNWNKLNCPKNPILGEGFDKPYTWQEAIEFPGAWDYGFIKYLLEEYKISTMTPANQLLLNETEQIRVAEADGRYLVFVRHNTSVGLARELTGYRARAIDLQTRRVALLDIDIEEGKSVIQMHPFYEDALLILEPVQK
ncbi:apiosidase-like domain-containing protein [Konateibacter massiliensis]|uniref:apiosidase-like domain-containing protein n=1 Tax=Konateibacter massiliensis TaxID=2002841 RepID=UPI000C1552A2|nr:DUF4038 domain-containing protein [Konateibacter massiliensis]